MMFIIYMTKTRTMAKTAARQPLCAARQSKCSSTRSCATARLEALGARLSKGSGGLVGGLKPDRDSDLSDAEMQAHLNPREDIRRKQVELKIRHYKTNGLKPMGLTSTLLKISSRRPKSIRHWEMCIAPTNVCGVSTSRSALLQALSRMLRYFG